jgi:hypothetical protein
VEDGKRGRARGALVHDVLHAVEYVRDPAAAPREAAEEERDAAGEVETTLAH